MAKLRVETAPGGRARTVAVVGTMPSVVKGRRVRAEGEWVLDARYGAQLKARATSAVPRQSGCKAR